MSDGEFLLGAYDEQMRGFGNAGRPGLIIGRDGPVLRAAGLHRGFVTAPRDLGVRAGRAADDRDPSRRRRSRGFRAMTF